MQCRTPRVIEKSQYYSELSDGAFDITISPLLHFGVFDERTHSTQ